MSPAELRKIALLINKAYEEAGKAVQTATLIEGDEETLIIDNRDEEEIN